MSRKQCSNRVNIKLPCNQRGIKIQLIGGNQKVYNASQQKTIQFDMFGGNPAVRQTTVVESVANELIHALELPSFF